jgi:hypothetical protein
MASRQKPTPIFTRRQGSRSSTTASLRIPVWCARTRGRKHHRCRPRYPALEPSLNQSASGHLLSRPRRTRFPLRRAAHKLKRCQTPVLQAEELATHRKSHMAASLETISGIPLVSPSSRGLDRVLYPERARSPINKVKPAYPPRPGAAGRDPGKKALQWVQAAPKLAGAKANGYYYLRV